jgi:hypothetical protein
MIEDEKNLLLKDLCCRLPYNVKVHAKYTDIGETIDVDGIVKMIDDDGVVGIEVINDFSSAWTYVQIDNVKPYLFPVSSMTEEQEKEDYEICKYYLNGYESKLIDFYHKNHLDHRGLIPMGLAKDATGLNIY